MTGEPATDDQTTGGVRLVASTSENPVEFVGHATENCALPPLTLASVVVSEGSLATVTQAENSDVLFASSVAVAVIALPIGTETASVAEKETFPLPSVV